MERPGLFIIYSVTERPTGLGLLETINGLVFLDKYVKWAECSEMEPKFDPHVS